MTARHSPLFTLRSGQSGLGIYTSGRDAVKPMIFSNDLTIPDCPAPEAEAPPDSLDDARLSQS